MIDLHSHTTASDGSCSPAELIAEARWRGIATLGITDHDTFDGFDAAAVHARGTGIDLICGIELSTKLSGGRSVHLLGYFLDENLHGSTLSHFRNWIVEMQVARRDRNLRLIARLQELGLDITLEEVEAKSSGLTARPHFAQVMLEKGYVGTLQEAFDRYLDESAKGYVYRQEPTLAEGIEKIRGAGGIAALAHPVRVPVEIESIIDALCAAGLNAIEAYHSDHSRADTRRYLEIADRYGLLVTGGSDYHGTTKPGIMLGTGRAGNVHVPADVLERMRAAGTRSVRGAA